MIKEMISRAIAGIGYGATAFLVLISLSEHVTVEFDKVVIVLLLSAAIGMSTQVLEIESISLLASVVIQFILSLVLSCIIMWYCGWKINGQFWVIFIISYVVVWIVVIIKQWTNIRRANEILKRKRKFK